MNEENKSKIEKYFNPPYEPLTPYSDKFVIAVLIGVGLIILSIALFSLYDKDFSEGRQLVYGFICLASGIGILYFCYLLSKKYKEKVAAYKLDIKEIITDDQLDTLAISAVSKNDFLQMALNKLGLDEDNVKEISPIFLQGYYYENIAGEKPKVVKGKDGRWRSDFYENSVLLFSESQVYSYNHRKSLIRNLKSEKTDEYFYKDIVSASTDSKETSVGDEKIHHEYFLLTTSGGTSISCSVMNADDTINQSITAMKHLLRQKKSE